MATYESTHVVPSVVKMYQKWYIDDPCGDSLSRPETGVDVYCREFNCESNGIRGLSWILGARGHAIEKRGIFGQKRYIDDPCGDSLSRPETGVGVYCREFNCESNGIRCMSWILGARGHAIEKRGIFGTFSAALIFLS